VPPSRLPGRRENITNVDDLGVVRDRHGGKRLWVDRRIRRGKASRTDNGPLTSPLSRSRIHLSFPPPPLLPSAVPFSTGAQSCNNASPNSARARKPTEARFHFPLLSVPESPKHAAGVCLHVSPKSATAQKLMRLSVAVESRGRGCACTFRLNDNL